MKNLINYYYNILIEEIRKVDDYYAIYSNNYRYALINFNYDLNYLKKIYYIIMSNNVFCHEIVINNFGNIITSYNNNNYILIKFKLDKEEINYNDILNYSFIVYEEENFSWKPLWESKIDYYEYQVNQMGYKYKTVKESFNYYIGLSENAISLLNYIDTSKLVYSISHRRIDVKGTDSFYNPINLIIDCRVRDIAEYYKINFFNDNLDSADIIKYISEININKNEAIAFFSRLLYPSYYFDLYDDIIQEKSNDEKLNKIIKKSTSYEILLKKIYLMFKYKYQIPEIEWLESN